MAGYPFERELAAAGVTRWVDLVRVRQGFIGWLGLWEDFSRRYGIEQQQRPRWAQRVRAAHRRLMAIVRDDPNAAAWRLAYIAALAEDAGGEDALRQDGGRARLFLSDDGYPLEVDMVERSLRDGWVNGHRLHRGRA